jgi:site-specific recombinase XerD
VNPSAQYLPPFGNVIIGSDDPQPFDPVAAWSDALELWLESRCSPNTQRAYAKAWQLFSESAGKQPWLVAKSDVLRWQEHMRQAGLTKETIQQRLAAVSSFYAFACASYTTYGTDGREQPLADYNPVAGIPRPRISPYNKSVYLSVDQVRALLRAIPQDSLQGLRDYALFMAYLLTGRRNSEIRLLRWGDFQVERSSPAGGGDGGEVPQKSWLARRPDPRRSKNPVLSKGGAGGGIELPSPAGGRRVGDEGLRVFYRWSGKGRKRRDECPRPLWDAITAYLHAAGRLGGPPQRLIQPLDYIFTPLSDRAARLPGVDPHVWSRRQPLSAREIGRLLKKYARRAGLDPTRLTVHSLRHSAAMLRKQAGDDLESISSFLGHSTLAVTQIYLHSLQGRSDATWLKVEALLGL